MSLKDDWAKAAEKFNASVNLQFEENKNNAAQNVVNVVGTNNYNMLAEMFNLPKGLTPQELQLNIGQLLNVLKKNLGAKTPIKFMVFELDIFNPPPPIVLLINPETFDIKFQSKFAENRVRQTNPNDSGYIIQFHHDELDMISASGRSAMFYTDGGLTAYDRVNSPGYNNIQQLIAYYRNNGKNLSRKPGKYSTIESVGRVLLTYNDILYKGSFESFTVNETDEKPFNLEFSFEYKVTKQIDTTGMSSDILRNIQIQQQNVGLVDIL